MYSQIIVYVDGIDVREVLFQNDVAIKRDSFVTTTVKLIVSGLENTEVEQGSSENPYEEVVLDFVDRLRKRKLLGKEGVEKRKY